VRVTQPEAGRVEVLPDAAAPLVRRMFCLDWDGDAFAALEDPVLRELGARHPGLRPVLFATPWEALCWMLIGHRISMAQAARLKDALRDAIGPEVGGRRAFPPPEAVLEHGAPGLPEIKAERVRALAQRGAAGELDAELLRAMEPDEAREWLERSPGIGPWSSAFVLIRGVGFPDLLPFADRRLAESVARHYGLPAPPDEAQFAEISARWAPFRAWAAFLLRAD
jgi:3-methyladenine DNA glycosylase/8-oxoguanine DNA glycosylase